MAVTGGNFEGMFDRLHKYLENDDLSKAMVVCQKVLAKIPGDTDALKVKCIILIRKSQFLEASEVASAAELKFERAYCLFRLQKYSDALQILENMPLDPAVLQV